ncbi:MAG: phosphoenolpyruvate carboxylase [Arhodomonas sp.]|nr:phosphoenolpyruvate carboxylase [Arhodomonas sp.]
MGGDRDGNPSVTAAVTREVCLLNRWMAVQLYEQEVSRLITELSLHCADEDLRKQVAGGAWEPYRALLKRVRARLRMAPGVDRGAAGRPTRRRMGRSTCTAEELGEPLRGLPDHSLQRVRRRGRRRGPAAGSDPAR